MSRIARIKPTGDRQTYFAMNTTVRELPLFQDEKTRSWIYDEILAFASIYCIELHALSILENRYLMVLTAPCDSLSKNEVKRRFEQAQQRYRHPKRWGDWFMDEWGKRLNDLSGFMRDVSLSVGRYINKRDQVKGRIWGDRFKSTLLDQGVALLMCMTHVAMSPMHDDAERSVVDYPCSFVGRMRHALSTGIAIPALGGLPGSSEDRLPWFRQFAEHLQTGPTDLDDLQTAFPYLEPKLFHEWVTKRQDWIYRSLVLGSESYCSEMIDRHKLQSPGLNRPYSLGNGLFNAHIRAGKSRR